MNEQAAYDAGQRAGREGKLSTANPYWQGSHELALGRLYRAWQWGWTQAAERAAAVREEAWDEDTDRYFCSSCDGPALPDERDDQGRCADCQERLAVTSATG